MIVFQWIMIPLLLLIGGICYQKLRERKSLRLLVMLILGLGLLFLAFPGLSIILAHTLGIGRGVDLIIYLGLLALTLACLVLYVRTVELQRRLDELIRQQAIEEARERYGEN